MRVILKTKKKMPKAPKTATKKSLENYLKRLSAVEAYNSRVEHENKQLLQMSEYAQRRVAGFGKKGRK